MQKNNILILHAEWLKENVSHKAAKECLQQAEDDKRSEKSYKLKKDRHEDTTIRSTDRME
tara:strand:- start:9326 stop:9505 length:180 start_codon:yes stop_codon:yes gene_type:complete